MNELTTIPPQITDRAIVQKLQKSLQTKIAEKAYDANAAAIDEAFVASKKLPGLEAKVDALADQVKRQPLQVTAKIPPPAKKDKPQKMARPLDLLVVTATAEFLRRSGKSDAPGIDKVARILLPKSTQARARSAAIDLFQKGAANTAGTNIVGWAAELTTAVTGTFWRDIEHASVAAALLGAGAHPLNMPRGANSISIPSRDRAKSMSASWVTENGTIPVLDGSLKSETINLHKMAAISTFTEELAETGVENIANVIRESITADTAEAIDAALLDTSAGVAGVRPGGLLNGALTQVSAGADISGILADFRFLISAMQDLRAARPVVCLNPLTAVGIAMTLDAQGHFPFRAEIASGSFFGLPLIQSANVPQDQLIGINTDALYVELSEPMWRASSNAVLTMLDADGVDPTMMEPGAVDTDGSVEISDAAGVAGGPAKVKPLFQQNAVALRMISPATWGLVAPGVAYVSEVAY